MKWAYLSIGRLDRLRFCFTLFGGGRSTTGRAPSERTLKFLLPFFVVFLIEPPHYFLLPPQSFHPGAGPAPVLPLSPSMILLTLQMRRVMMRLMASQGLLGPLATEEATMGARDNTMTAPSNTWGWTHTHTHTNKPQITCIGQSYESALSLGSKT